MLWLLWDDIPHIGFRGGLLVGERGDEFFIRFKLKYQKRVNGDLRKWLGVLGLLWKENILESSI